MKVGSVHSLSESMEAAFRAVAINVIQVARIHDTKIIIWRDEQVTYLTPDEAQQELELAIFGQSVSGSQRNIDGLNMKSDFRQLMVWQKAMDVVTQLYKATRAFPKEEMYGLTSQLRRSAVSIPSNIAEGQARPTKGEFIQFLGYAKGSLAELETQIIIAQNLEYLADATEILESASEVGRLLNGLINSLKPKPTNN